MNVPVHHGYAYRMSLATVQRGEELVVLVDDDGRHIGTAPKSSVHHEVTPLHLGFSCYLFDSRGGVLLTRRALGKPTFPGVWTNSFCGHPAPSEEPGDAVRRRARQELGVALGDVECLLPEFRYQATAADGTVENEICPVFCARTDDPVRPSPDEIMEYRWVAWDDLHDAARLPWSISPWAAQQVPLLEAVGSAWIAGAQVE